MRIPTFVGSVESRDAVTPLMQRLTIGGEGLRGLTSTGIPDERVKLILSPDGRSAPALPAFDETGIHFPADQPRPVTRTFTVRRFDEDSSTLTIDVALHETGPAATWARTAAPGSPIGIAGPNALPAPADTFAHAVYVGDASALPAVARTLEELPPGRTAEAIVLIDNPDERQALDLGPDATIAWVYESDRENDRPVLEQALRALGPIGDGTYVWAAGEADTMRAIRRYLRDECGLPRTAFQVSGYWRRRLDEDQAITEHLAAVEAARAAGASETEIEDAGIY